MLHLPPHTTQLSRKKHGSQLKPPALQRLLGHHLSASTGGKPWTASLKTPSQGTQSGSSASAPSHLPSPNTMVKTRPRRQHEHQTSCLEQENTPRSHLGVSWTCVCQLPGPASDQGQSHPRWGLQRQECPRQLRTSSLPCSGDPAATMGSSSAPTTQCCCPQLGRTSQALVLW